MTQSERFQFLVSDCLATGEGHTVCCLITLATPQEHLDDYIEPPSFDENWQYNPGTLKTTAQERAKREFSKLFGDWYAIGVEYLSPTEFLQKYHALVPDAVRATLEDSELAPANFHYSARFHANYS